jgi:hypothetical protein
VFLMDSTDLPGRWLVQHTEFVLPRGRFRVQTGRIETPDTYIVVHRLRPEPRHAEPGAAADTGRL